jgi:hypothetical protein
VPRIPALRGAIVLPLLNERGLRDYRTFFHRYAVTSPAARGKTVDEVTSSQSFYAVNQESFYVRISCTRERVRICTDDAQLLGRRVEDTHRRKAAIELEGLREGCGRPVTAGRGTRKKRVRHARSMSGKTNASPRSNA